MRANKRTDEHVAQCLLLTSRLWAVQNHRTMGRNALKSTHLFHKPKALSDYFGSERTSEQMNAVEQSKECGESELVSGGGEQISGQMNGPVVYASIPVYMYHSSHCTE